MNSSMIRHGFVHRIIAGIATISITMLLLVIPAGVASASGTGQITVSISNGPTNASVDVLLNGNVVGSATTDGAGAATYVISSLSDSSYQLGARVGTTPVTYEAQPVYGVVIDPSHQSRNASLALTQFFTGSGQVTGVPAGTQSLSFSYSSNSNSYFIPSTPQINTPTSSQAFSIAGLPNGSWTVSVNADSAASGSATFTVVNGVISSPISVTLQASQTISGTVIDSNGEPIPNVQVTLNKPGNQWGDACDGSSNCQSTTDSSGVYSISGVSYASVKPQLSLDLSSAGFTSSAMMSIQTAMPVSSSSAADIVFPLGAFTLSGTVQEDVTSANIAGANLSGTVFLGSYSLSFSATTNSQGEYQVPRMPNGTGSFSVSKYVSNTSLYLMNSNSFQINNANKTKNAYLIQTPTGTASLSGHITNSSNVGIQNASVNLQEISSGATYFGSTDSNGDYSIISLPAGVYRAGFSAQNNRYYSTSVTVGSGASVTRNVTLQSYPTGNAVVSGVVTDIRTNQPISGATVGFYSMSLPFFSATTAADGSWSVSGVPDGTYNFWLNSPQGSQVSYDYSERDQLVVTGGANVIRNDGLVSIVAGTASIYGTLKNSITHEPMTNVSIGAYRTSGYFAIDNVTTNSKGEFTFTGLPAGQYSINAEVEGYTADLAPTDEGSEQGGGGGPGVPLGFVDLETGEAAKFLGKATPMILGNATVSGVVRTSAGRLVEGAWVGVSTSTGAYLGGTQTNELGQYSISGLPVGSIVVSTSSPSINYAVTEQTANLQSSGTTVDLVITAAGIISGSVKDSSGNAIPCAVVKAYRVNNDNTVGTLVSASQADYGDSQTPGDGSYNLSHLSPGDYYVRLAQECWGSTIPVTMNFATSFWNSNAPAGTESPIQRVTVTSGTIVADKDFVVSNSGGSLNGEVGVQTSSGIASLPLGKYAVASIYKLVSGTYVVQGYLTTWLSARSGGMYSFNGLAPGSYKIKFTDPLNSSRGYATTFIGGDTLDSATVFTVTAGSRQTVPQVGLESKSPNSNAEAVTSSSLSAVLEDQIDAPNSIEANQEITVDVGQDMAGEWVSVWAHSTPTSLGDWVQVGADGTVTATVSEALPAGQHRIVVQDVDNKVIGWTGTTVATSVEGTSSTGGQARKVVSGLNNIGTAIPALDSPVKISPKKSSQSDSVNADAEASSIADSDQPNIWIFGGLAAVFAAGLAGAVWLIRTRKN